MKKAKIIVLLCVILISSGMFLGQNGCISTDCPNMKGNWEVMYLETYMNCNNSKLIIASQTQCNVSGYFDWICSDGSYGQEIVEGNINVRDLTIVLTGTALNDSKGLKLGIYEGTLSEDGNMIKDGTSKPATGEPVVGWWSADKTINKSR